MMKQKAIAITIATFVAAALPTATRAVTIPLHEGGVAAAEAATPVTYGYWHNRWRSHYRWGSYGGGYYGWHNRWRSHYRWGSYGMWGGYYGYHNRWRSHYRWGSYGGYWHNRWRSHYRWGSRY